VSHVDGSAGWTLSFMALSAGLVGGHVSDAGAQEILDRNGGRWPRFTERSPPPASSSHRRRVVTERPWGFASGIDHAQWLAVGARQAGAAPTDRTAMLWAALPVDHANVVAESWNVDGMRATGSRTFTLDGLVLPESRVFSIHRGQHARQCRAPIPTLVFISPNTRGSPWAWPGARSTSHRSCQGQGAHGRRAPLHARGAFLRDIGRADTRLRAARALIVDRLREGDAAVAPMPLDFVTDVRAAAAHVPTLPST